MVSLSTCILKEEVYAYRKSFPLKILVAVNIKKDVVDEDEPKNINFLFSKNENLFEEEKRAKEKSIEKTKRKIVHRKFYVHNFYNSIAMMVWCGGYSSSIICIKPI